MAGPPAFRPAPFAGWRSWSLLLALLLSASCLLRPTLPLERPVYRYLAVIDITQSMNVPDYRDESMPRDRLGYVKQSLRQLLADLPCGSELGLGLFTTQNTQILFEPLEVCGHYAAIDDALEHLDWRMAWAADSFIAHGLYSALEQMAGWKKPVRLAFFSDGQQIPQDLEIPPYRGNRGAIAGLLVGVGGTEAVPIPRYDQDNRPLGDWRKSDLDVSPGNQPPAGQMEGPLLSRLDEQHLSTLAAATGLGYARLTTAAGLGHALMRPELAVSLKVGTDMRPVLGVAALLLWLSGLVRRNKG
jgi:mxaL protein